MRMDTVIFSSWEGRVVDNREGKAPTASKARDSAFPSPPEGGKALALMGWNGLVVMNPEADVVSLTMNYLKEARKLSCGECSVCMIGIDRLLDIFGKIAQGDGNKKDLFEVRHIIRGVSVNSKCNFGRSVLFPVLDSIKYYKPDFLAVIKGEKKLEDKDYSCTVTAPCMEACPASLDIPGYIELIRNNRF
jgi:formate dehydrogenase beta subunit